ncbi:MAG: hypothetical protein WBF58_09285 [Xanthobacteraceae bacterium]
MLRIGSIGIFGQRELFPPMRQLIYFIRQALGVAVFVAGLATTAIVFFYSVKYMYGRWTDPTPFTWNTQIMGLMIGTFLVWVPAFFIFFIFAVVAVFIAKGRGDSADCQ